MKEKSNKSLSFFFFFFFFFFSLSLFFTLSLSFFFFPPPSSFPIFPFFPPPSLSLYSLLFHSLVRSTTLGRTSPTRSVPVLCVL